jgi:hypothetical protein
VAGGLRSYAQICSSWPAPRSGLKSGPGPGSLSQQREEHLHVEPDRSGLGDWDTLPVESIATPADLASACLFLRRPTRDPHVATALLAVVAVALEFADQI